MSHSQEEMGSQLPDESDVADAFQAIASTNSYINNADAKAGLAAAAAAALVVAMTQQSKFSVMLAPHSALQKWALSVLVLFGISICVTILEIGLALMPRIHSGGMDNNRFSFPSISTEEWHFVSTSRAQAAEESWIQAQTLARIAVGKFAHIKVALSTLGFSFFLFCLWATIAARA